MTKPNRDFNSYPQPENAPDAWIYDFAVIKWIFTPALGNQLPFWYQFFRAYAFLYLRLSRQTYLKGGRALFRFLGQFLGRISSQSDSQPELRLKLPEYEIFVDPRDARFFQVVNELTDPKSDVKVLSELLAAGDTFIDIGANHGSFAIVASKIVGASGRVIAVEPQPHLAQIVEKNLSLNALAEYKVYAVAVGEINGEIELLIPRGTSGSAGIFALHSGIGEFRAIKVPIKRFADLISWQELKLTGKVVIKLDIEGSENAFLLGAAPLIESLKPILIIEIHPTTLKAAHTTGENLKQLLQNLGYARFAEMHDLKTTSPIIGLNTELQRNVVLFWA